MTDNLQDTFSGALFDESQNLDSLHIHTHYDKNELIQRLSIYRNNVVTSLIDVLSNQYPVTKNVVGERFFNASAKNFITQSPPTSAILIFYGDGFAQQIGDDAAKHTLHYVKDLAQIEAAQHSAYYSEDQRALTPNDFAQLAVDTLVTATVKLNDSVRLIRSAYAVYSIWEENNNGSNKKIDADNPQNILVFREGFNIRTLLVSDAMAIFLNGLIEKKSIGVALDIAINSSCDKTDIFVPAQAIQFIIECQLIIQLQT